MRKLTPEEILLLEKTTVIKPVVIGSTPEQFKIPLNEINSTIYSDPENYVERVPVKRKISVALNSQGETKNKLKVTDKFNLKELRYPGRQEDIVPIEDKWIYVFLKGELKFTLYSDKKQGWILVTDKLIKEKKNFKAGNTLPILKPFVQLPPNDDYLFFLSPIQLTEEGIENIKKNKDKIDQVVKVKKSDDFAEVVLIDTMEWIDAAKENYYDPCLANYLSHHNDTLKSTKYQVAQLGKQKLGKKKVVSTMQIDHSTLKAKTATIYEDKFSIANDFTPEDIEEFIETYELEKNYLCNQLEEAACYLGHFIESEEYKSIEMSWDVKNEQYLEFQDGLNRVLISWSKWSKDLVQSTWGVALLHRVYTDSKRFINTFVFNLEKITSSGIVSKNEEAINEGHHGTKEYICFHSIKSSFAFTVSQVSKSVFEENYPSQDIVDYMEENKDNSISAEAAKIALSGPAAINTALKSANKESYEKKVTLEKASFNKKIEYLKKKHSFYTDDEILRLNQKVVDSSNLKLKASTESFKKWESRYTKIGTGLSATQLVVTLVEVANEMRDKKREVSTGTILKASNAVFQIADFAMNAADDHFTKTTGKFNSPISLTSKEVDKLSLFQKSKIGLGFVSSVFGVVTSYSTLASEASKGDSAKNFSNTVTALSATTSLVGFISTQIVSNTVISTFVGAKVTAYATTISVALGTSVVGVLLFAVPVAVSITAYYYIDNPFEEFFRFSFFGDRAGDDEMFHWHTYKFSHFKGENPKDPKYLNLRAKNHLLSLSQLFSHYEVSVSKNSIPLYPDSIDRLMTILTGNYNPESFFEIEISIIPNTSKLVPVGRDGLKVEKVYTALKRYEENLVIKLKPSDGAVPEGKISRTDLYTVVKNTDNNNRKEIDILITVPNNLLQSACDFNNVRFDSNVEFKIEFKMFLSLNGGDFREAEIDGILNVPSSVATYDKLDVTTNAVQWLYVKDDLKRNSYNIKSLDSDGYIKGWDDVKD